MKNLPIHENLDTSFVNLSALVRYLRRQQFVGSVCVELNGYEANITLSEGNDLKVREHDRVAGRIAEGEEAFQRLLIRAREPGGTIHVYQLVEDTETIEEKIQAAVESANGKPFVEKEILEQIPPTNGNSKKEEIILPLPQTIQEQVLPAKSNKPLTLDFSNQVEEKARQAQLTTQEWQTLLQLMGELLGAVDKSLAAAKLNFDLAFEKACTEISEDYPFLKSASGTFAYSNGKVTMHRQVSAKLFSASINEAIRRILEKLRSNPKFAGVYRHAVHTILALIHQRKPLYDKFFITPKLEKNLGI